MEHTENGEVAEKITRNLNEKLIKEESRYDWLYVIFANLDDYVVDIIKKIKIDRNRRSI